MAQYETSNELGLKYPDSTEVGLENAMYVFRALLPNQTALKPTPIQSYGHVSYPLYSYVRSLI